MEFDIEICSCVIWVKEIIDIIHVSDTYFTVNWNDFSDICPDHILSIECDCKHVHLWSFNTDCNGRRGDDVRDRAQKALDLLNKYSISPSIPDPNNRSWASGLTRKSGKILPMKNLKDRFEVFAYHLQRFRDLGDKYLDFFFRRLDEPSSEIILPDGNIIPIRIKKDKVRVSYFSHPYKQNFRVTGFKSAVEVFGILSGQNDPEADNWYNMALKMLDAPGNRNTK